MPLVMKFANSVRFVLPRITAPGGAQLGDDGGVLGRDRVLQRDAARGGRQAGDVEVVLDQHRQALQRAADVAGRALEVGDGRVLERRGVDDADGVDARPARVDRRDPVDVRACELHARQLARRHLLLQLGDRQALEIERRIGGLGRSGTDQHQHRQQAGYADRLDAQHPRPLSLPGPFRAQLNPARRGLSSVRLRNVSRRGTLEPWVGLARDLSSWVANSRATTHTGPHDVLRAPCVRRRT